MVNLDNKYIQIYIKHGNIWDYCLNIWDYCLNIWDYCLNIWEYMGIYTIIVSEYNNGNI